MELTVIKKRIFVEEYSNGKKKISFYKPKVSIHNNYFTLDHYYELRFEVEDTSDIPVSSYNYAIDIKALIEKNNPDFSLDNLYFYDNQYRYWLPTPKYLTKNSIQDEKKRVCYFCDLNTKVPLKFTKKDTEKLAEQKDKDDKKILIEKFILPVLRPEFEKMGIVDTGTHLMFSFNNKNKIQAKKFIVDCINAYIKAMFKDVSLSVDDIEVYSNHSGFQLNIPHEKLSTDAFD